MTDEEVGYAVPGDYSIGSDVWPGLAKLVEEMGELNQVLGKIMAGGGELIYWDGTDLRINLCEEIADVKAALWFFMVYNQDELKIDGEFFGPVDRRTRYKQDKLTEWHNNYQRRTK